MIETNQSVRMLLVQALLLSPDLSHESLILPLNGPLWSMPLEIVVHVA
jgi:hypothetical protein